MTRTRLITAFACLFTLFSVPTAIPAGRDGSDRHDQGALGPAPSPALLQEVLGTSGNLRALIGTPTVWAEDSLLAPLLTREPVNEAGVHPLGIPAPDGEPIVAVTLEPFGRHAGSRLQAAAPGYRVGRWPTRGPAALDPRYAPPAGFIPVTLANESTSVSKHFRLRDFLTHDQQGVWPKVLILRPILLDKLELINEALDSRGLPSAMHIMSGFRTPQYNALGVGSKGGRAEASRHMYGDAADVIVDANGDGVMDDLNGDGKVTVADARLLLAVAESVELEHPALVGGLSAYPASSAHGPFVHVDARGFRARW